MPNIKERRDYILSFSWDILLLVLGGGFLSGFIDSIAGGGGLIALPVLLALQIPPHYAIGTNKFAATFGAAVSSYQFFKAGKVDMHLLYRLMPFTLGGAIIGCLFMLHLSAETLQPLVILSLIAAAVFVFTRRGLGQHSSYTGMTQKTFWQGAAFALVIGLYDGFIGPGTGTFLIIAFAMLGEDESKTAAATLNQMVIENGYHLNTGFLSTPFLCDVLAKYGYVDTAYKLLLQPDAPGWLYEVGKGATTVWETWTGIDENGKPHESLNHYSYGAICGWLFGGVCGIHYADGTLTIAPTPDKSLDWAKATYDSPAGRIVSGWRYNGDAVAYEFEIPANLTADVTLPDGRKLTLAPGKHTV